MYTRFELNNLETIEQSWSGDELKIEDETTRIWLTHRENRKWDGDYQIETLINGRWEIKVCYFE